jgi:hypothetical protein
MPAYYDVLDPEDLHPELDDCHAVEIAGDDQIGYIAMYQQLAGAETQDFVGRDATVGATDPQILGTLLRGESLEKLGVLAQASLDPTAIVFEKLR